MALTDGREAGDQDWLDVLGKVARAGVYGVASTGIYCDFGCPSRTPLRKNLRIFAAAEQAEAAGYRRCRRCARRGVPAWTEVSP
ncbi:Ada metal-binding domain-containing protein [Cypionkella sp.]|uniref:Ada metal-binding domain-containing protein n=1 Tax=Cypionkella sp. TaxID=2811411 RepID=UPI00272645D0|nr:Ada metal-binding domain-containing protein [Cypionkella sp.]MDO8982850.1 Ada metal-binding domain-containing protein [Cypionkella sp.]MDP1577196.1 Ada metal-binding domain-containing protein [Cypionkella sp.]MDP2049598.1 Ada metal-binding domain-containing protein [Cypionkella sp.]